jgi:hypothetical protein
MYLQQRGAADLLSLLKALEHQLQSWGFLSCFCFQLVDCAMSRMLVIVGT